MSTIIKIDELPTLPAEVVTIMSHNEVEREGRMVHAITLGNDENEFVNYYFIGDGMVEISTDIDPLLQGKNPKLSKYTNPWKPVAIAVTDTIMGFDEHGTTTKNTSVNDSDSFIDTYAYFMPMCIVGDPGSGKTYGARKFGETADYFIEVQCDSSLEPIDLRGGIVPSTNDDNEKVYVWRDGMLSQAFRRAADGHKVVLLLDEVLRIDARERSIFLSSLSPNSDNNYVLKTRKVIKDENGYDVEEQIEAPVDNLCIIATTNSGASFDIDRADPAFKDRFVFKRQDSNISKVMKVVKSLTEDESLHDTINMTYTNLMKFHVAGDLTGKPSLRHMCNIIKMINHGIDLREAMRRHYHVWAGEDRLTGRLIETEVAIIQRVIDKAME